MKSIKYIIYILLCFLFTSVSCDEDCLSVFEESELMTFRIKPSSIAKKVVISLSPKNGFYIPKEVSVENEKVSSIMSKNNKLSFEVEAIDEISPGVVAQPTSYKVQSIPIFSKIPERHREFSFDITVYAYDKLFFKKHVTIKTGKYQGDGDDRLKCIEEVHSPSLSEFTTLKQVSVDDMKYVTKVAKKDALFIFNEALEISF